MFVLVRPTIFLLYFADSTILRIACGLIVWSLLLSFEATRLARFREHCDGTRLSWGDGAVAIIWPYRQHERSGRHVGSTFRRFVCGLIAWSSRCFSSDSFVEVAST
jgi:hypothetical protein